MCKLTHIIKFQIFLSLLFGSWAVAQNPNNAPLWVDGEYIVKYNLEEIEGLKKIPGLGGYSTKEIQAALTLLLGLSKKEDLPLVDAATLKGDNLDIETAIALLDSGLSDYISPNYIQTASAIPNDTSYSSLWGMNQPNDIDINGPEAWDKVNPEDVNKIVVAIIDTGIDYNHPDLRDNMWVNTVEQNGTPGVDDDGNGIVDDIHGYNAISNNGNPMDDQSHGSHCAGTIGGVGNNGMGVAGVAWNVKLMALKFLDSGGRGSDSNAIKAINYAVQNKNKNGSLKVLSNSWGGSGYNPALLSAITAANNAGLLFVAAAGNDNKNTDSNANYPSNYDVPNVISIAALDQNGNRASFSNYGSTTVDIGAPGVGIYSTVLNGGYASYNGTSMATPHVAGIAALGYSQSTLTTPQEMKAILMDSYKPITALNNLMVSPGMIDASKTLSDNSNSAPNLQSIPNQYIRDLTRVITVPLIASDAEDDPLEFKAEIEGNSFEKVAADTDQQYQFNNYIPQYDNFYRLGEKRLTSSTGLEYFIFSDGSIYEFTYPYYRYKTTIDASYYENPTALVNAYPLDFSEYATLSVTNGAPGSLSIKLSDTFKGSFSIIVTVSDGNKTSSSSFLVTTKEPEICS